MDSKIKLIQKINASQNQLNIQLASRYEHELDNQLTAKQVLLLELIQNGIASTKDLSQHLNTSMSAVSQLLNKLEAKEYITRHINKENRREIILNLAPKAELYFDKLQELNDDINYHVYGQLPLEDLQHLDRILSHLNTIVEEV
ncbi:hypothetical protein J18TS1_17370 [Oceanobacillus oncorhynchi subsp. incaldanensis]|uniref:MarR family protein n=1 Tax=Oceanobacillus oncorhynchi TaxID=545501 RepID=A0A0A1MFL1_9BACI|nr:MarR family transcriptional regulator [Oceanobacillus oncorhynchi]GIO18637.1 hypothetical protein J18TS1_17370 [Oceanobacillus oncorhynchi subsp. incaldanensis]CEI81853.1 MarR family protein [Oceanobacillus oncorhynchi]